ncbi:MAG: pyrroline-5-carboxylate reductase [Chloroflexi bacterium]|nr:pyrroline-5-carboxylate reductase [Chloroflexota bacterium]
MKLAFVGGGAMGEAMLSGILGKKVASPADVVVSDVSQSILKQLKDKYGVGITGDNRVAARGADVVVLAVKPQHLAPVLAEFKGTLTASQLVLSIVAGASISALSQGSGHDRVVRVMPNIAARVGEAVSLWAAMPQVTDAQKEQARALLAAFGTEIFTTEEKYLDMATAVNGSGPGYVFLFIEAFIDAAVHIGMPRDIAWGIVLQTVSGSTRLAKETKQHPAELRNQVTSPGGTTAEGLLRLEEGGFRALVTKAVQAAYDKSRGLGQTK